MNTGVVRLKISSIGPGTTNSLVVGIIIAKQSPRAIISKIDSKQKYVFSFTVRDSPEDIINVSVWGSKNYISHLYDSYKVGDVVDLISAHIKYKPATEEKYMPESSSAFLLTLNENSSQMLLHDVKDSINYKYLLKLLTCPKNMFLTILSIHSSGKVMCGKFCNLLVVVRCVNPIKSIKRKNGNETFLREIIVMDKTHPTLAIKIWDKEISERATQWIRKKTVLALADVCLEWNIYRKSVTAVVSNKTIITEDPDTNEANDLKNVEYTHSTEQINTINTIDLPNLSTIIDVMSCKRILMKSNERCAQEFTAVLYAIVSKFDIDGLFQLVLTKCNLCGTNVESTQLLCLNPECPSNGVVGIGSVELESTLNIRLSLTDSTGTLDNCRLHYNTAAKILNGINHFQNLSIDQKTELKWKYLFTNCAIKLVVSKSNVDERSLISIVDIDNEGPIFQFISRTTIN